jgi:exopolyphosphatase/guanosine-5'-triphosphate,3'-diphosphate pyrophosphatase
MARVACIDIGTVTVRLALSSIKNASVCLDTKISTICNLGEGVDKNSYLSPTACKRVIDCIAGYMDKIKNAHIESVCCTMTSAARDAANSSTLVDALRKFGLEPQVIPGEVEGKLTLLGVAQDFFDQPILVVDNGGGSTEFACGVLETSGLLVHFIRSINVGCRRLSERYLSHADPPLPEDLACVHSFAAEQISTVMDDIAGLPGNFGHFDHLVVCGGTATTLVAIDKRLTPYNSAQVHLQRLSANKVRELEGKLASLTLSERALLPGLQAKRAPVIVAGAAILVELMRQVGCDEMVVSESDLLVGLSLVCDATISGQISPIGWTPIIVSL